MAIKASNSVDLRTKTGMQKTIAPKAEKIPHPITIHDHTRVDNYFWLRLSDEQKSLYPPDDQTSKVLDYLNRENEYTKAVMQPTEGLQQKLYDEIVGRIKQDDESVPYFLNGYWYYSRFVKGSEYAIYCRKKSSKEAPESIVLDENKLAEGHDFFQLGGISVSPDNTMIAYGIDTIGRRKYTIYIQNLETGEILENTIPNTTGSCVWANDNQTIFYTTKDEKNPAFG